MKKIKSTKKKSILDKLPISLILTLIFIATFSIYSAIPVTFTDGTVISASDFNTNFTNLDTRTTTLEGNGQWVKSGNDISYTAGNVSIGSGTNTYPTTPSGGTGSLIIKGNNADYRIVHNDGGGNLNKYYNAYFDGGHKYQVTGAANRIATTITKGEFNFQVAPAVQLAIIYRG